MVRPNAANFDVAGWPHGARTPTKPRPRDAGQGGRDGSAMVAMTATICSMLHARMMRGWRAHVDVVYELRLVPSGNHTGTITKRSFDHSTSFGRRQRVPHAVFCNGRTQYLSTLVLSAAIAKVLSAAIAKNRY